MREAYEESIRCFLFERDLAASNMICSTIEAIIREVTVESKEKFVKLIDKLESEKKISNQTSAHLHILRKIRNEQSHTVNTLDELSLLTLFKTVGDIIAELEYVQ